MRPLTVSLLASLAALSLPAMAPALSFQTRLEHSEWSVEGDKFECRLSQPVANFGYGEFVRRAGEQVTFRLKSRERWLQPGSATLLAAAAPWRPGQGDINLGSVRVEGAEVPFNSSQEQGVRLLAGVLEGRSPVVRHRTPYGGDNLEVRLLPARFQKAYEQYQECAAKLLPVNYDQIRQTQLGFPGGGIELEPRARAKIDIILDFVKADPSINFYRLDGHSDNSGNRLSNRDLSRRRALTVKDYLISQGVPPEQIEVRFHGETYPLVPNNSPQNRATNRRVTLTLDKLPVPETESAAASSGAAPPPVQAKSDPKA